jgi:hypothetical protein
MYNILVYFPCEPTDERNTYGVTILHILVPHFLTKWQSTATYPAAVICNASISARTCSQCLSDTNVIQYVSKNMLIMSEQ